LGATGYTGRLIAHEALRPDLRRGWRVVLAGRSADKLAALRAEFGSDLDLETAVVDVNDGVALRRLADDADALITTVGPYLSWGHPALLAALDGQAHYLDISGELEFLRWARERDGDARRAGIALCPGFGYDGFPGDVLAGLAAQKLGVTPTDARVAYLVRHARVSGGTLRSMVGIGRSGGASWHEGELVSEPFGAKTWSVPFPEPLGAQSALSAPLADLLTIGPSTGATQVEAYHVTAAAKVVSPMAGALARMGPLVFGGPVGQLIEQVAARAPEGPSLKARDKMLAATLAEVRRDQQVVRAWGRLRDPYGITAKIVVGMAEHLLSLDHPPIGALTPTTALRPAGALENEWGTDAAAFLDQVGVDWAIC